MTEFEEYLPLKPEFFHILLALEDDELHGWGIIKRVEENTSGGITLEPSQLYRRLKKLSDDGIVGAAPHESGTDERRRYYCLTKKGRGVLRAEAARLVALGTDARVRRLAGP